MVPSKVVGGPVKIHCTAGRFHGNPVSRNQPRSWPSTNTVTLKELEWRYLPNLKPMLSNSYEGWEGLGA